MVRSFHVRCGATLRASAACPAISGKVTRYVLEGGARQSSCPSPSGEVLGIPGRTILGGSMGTTAITMHDRNWGSTLLVVQRRLPRRMT